MKQKNIVLWAIGFILLGIILGAFGAHALKERISSERLVSFETGVRYQMYHGLALLALAAFNEKWQLQLRWSYRLILLGTVLFSFSIYGLALQELTGWSLRFLGPITPLGGLLLIAAWSMIMLRVFKFVQK